MAKLRVLTERPPEAEGTEAEQIEALRDFLFRLTEELRHVLLHLDERNFSPGVKLGTEIGDSLTLKELVLSGGITGEGWSIGVEDSGLVIRFGETTVRLSDRVDADLRRAETLDFSTWDAGAFSETLEGGNNFVYLVDFDNGGRPVKIYDEEHECAVVW